MSVKRVFLTILVSLIVGHVRVARSQIDEGPQETVKLAFHDQTLTVEAVNNSKETYLRVGGPTFPLRKLTLPSEVGSVESVSRSHDGRVIVVTETSASVREVLIYDQMLGSMTDRFLCYRPSISPDGRYIAFTKFFPAHFISEQSASNFLMLYNLEATPEENRGADFAPSSYTEVGVQLYPSTDSDPEKGPIHTFMSDRFFWSSDSSRLVLLDQEYSTVVPTASQVPKSNLHLPPRPALKFIEVNVLEHPIQVRSLASNVCLVESGASCMIRLVAISFNDGFMTADLAGIGFKSTVRKSLELHRSEFVPVDFVR